jgi:hypothetical protein
MRRDAARQECDELTGIKNIVELSPSGPVYGGTAGLVMAGIQ